MITPFLMFTGQAEQAMNYYCSVFDRSEITSLQRNPDGSVMHATFAIHGQTFRCIDSPPVHAFTFTPSTSFWVACDTDEEVERVFGQLAEGGTVLMPLAAYPFSPKYGWVQDKFGVSWQVSL